MRLQLVIGLVAVIATSGCGSKADAEKPLDESKLRAELTSYCEWQSLRHEYAGVTRARTAVPIEIDWTQDPAVVEVDTTWKDVAPKVVSSAIPLPFWLASTPAAAPKTWRSRDELVQACEADGGRVCELVCLEDPDQSACVTHWGLPRDGDRERLLRLLGRLCKGGGLGHSCRQYAGGFKQDSDEGKRALARATELDTKHCEERNDTRACNDAWVGLITAKSADDIDHAGVRKAAKR